MNLWLLNLLSIPSAKCFNCDQRGSDKVDLGEKCPVGCGKFGFGAKRDHFWANFLLGWPSSSGLVEAEEKNSEKKQPTIAKEGVWCDCVRARAVLVASKYALSRSCVRAVLGSVSVCRRYS